MQSLDLATTPLREINAALQAQAAQTNQTQWVIENPKGAHAIAVGLDAPIEVTVKGSPPGGRGVSVASGGIVNHRLRTARPPSRGASTSPVRKSQRREPWVRRTIVLFGSDADMMDSFSGGRVRRGSR